MGGNTAIDMSQNSNQESDNSVRSKNPMWRRYVNGLIAEEISTISEFCDRTIQVAPRSEDRGLLLGYVRSADKRSESTIESAPSVASNSAERVLYLLNGNMNYDLDIEATLVKLKAKLNRFCRVSVVAYNPYLRFVYSLANRLGIRKGEEPTTFLTQTDLENISKLAGFEVVRIRPVAYLPFRLLGLGDLVNKILSSIPLLRWLSLAAVITLRPILKESVRPSLSVVIPARNEKGNIENALTRLETFRQYLGRENLEVIFIEGHSSDDTWGEIQRVIPQYSDRYKIIAFQQTGKGKSDAVRLGFSKASGELLTILDADLTMPPELLHRFYDAYCRGLGDFINGNRLTYPMEGQAMKFLNHLGNRFFAKALSVVLESKLGDSLCGTKLVTKIDYDRMIAWRGKFGDFDPFGDFELLFPASILGLGIVDVPIRYRDRTYGSTNIRRFYHGWMLLKMTFIGLLRVRFGATPNNDL